MKIFLLGVAAMFMLSFGAVGVAHAYSTSGTTQTSAPTDLSGVNTLLSPFENFIQSLKWPTSGPLVNINTGGISTTITPPQIGFNIDGVNINNNSLQNLWHEIVAAPLSTIATLILNVIAWVLGVALQIVNWLKGLIH
jgi:hypothetical protein